MIYRIDDTLAYAAIDWPHRSTVEWSSWRDIPDRYETRNCAVPLNRFWHCVVQISGGPQWDELLQSLGSYEPPGSLRERTLITLAVLYVAGPLHTSRLVGGGSAPCGRRRIAPDFNPGSEGRLCFRAPPGA